MFATMQILRTADEHFADLPEFPYAPRYCEVSDQDGGTLRVAWVEDGPAEADPVLMLHGEPSWSFLYRRMIPILAAAGHRVICPDLVGFGRSDKPTRIEDHTYARHVEWMRALAFDVLDLQRVTLVGQDWGGLIGLRLAAEHPDRFARIVVANTGLPTGDLPMPEIWWRFREAIQGAPEIQVGRFVEVGLPSPDDRRRPRRLRRAVPRRHLLRRPARDAGSGPDDARRPRLGGQPCRMESVVRQHNPDARRVQRRRSRSPVRWPGSSPARCAARRASTIRSSRTRGISCRRMRAKNSPRPLFDFCDSSVSPFAVQQDTLMANVPEVRKLGLAVSKPSAVPVMS